MKRKKLNQEKVAIVNGGMYGIGLAAIKFMLANDWIVIATTPTPRTFRKEIDIKHKNLKIISIVQNDAAFLQPFIDRILSIYGKIDLLINHEIDESISTATTKDYQSAAIAMSHHVLSCMKSKSTGHILFVSFSKQGVSEKKSLIKDFMTQNQYALENVGIKFTVIDSHNKILL